MKLIAQTIIIAALTTGAGQTFAKPLPVNNIYGIETQDRHLSGFSAVSVAGSFDVYITQGGSESVKVEADDDVINNIITEVKGGVLKIYTKNQGFNWNWGDKKRVVHVTAKNLNAISLSGSGDVFFKDGIRAQSLALSLSGSGDITGKVEVTNLTSSIVGSGDITVIGRAETSTSKVSGSGDFTAKGLLTTNSIVKVVGSGDAVVNASQKVDAAVTGSGDIRYTGGAKQISTSKTGSGDISRY
ncbi:head GIN domain-containing protein [Mucilaginibacter sp. PAMB04274]|uniref:head GIN domain-containing protein n=1 Tax=Mucilaginibacter sp. PAMB04274 TaxID=3138568 RepID=UPI0031F7206B